MKLLLCLLLANFMTLAPPAFATTTAPPNIQFLEDQSSGEIVRQLMIDYRKFAQKAKKNALKKDPTWWAQQNLKWNELERRRADLKEVLSDGHKKKLKRWADEYERLQKRPA